MEGERVSHSRISEFIGCRYKYWFHYILGYVTQRIEQPPTLGSAGHAGLAAGILRKNVDQALEEWKQTYLNNHSMYNMKDEQGNVDEEVNAVLEGMTDDIMNHASLIVPRALDHLHLDDWETVIYRGQPLVEAKFVIPLVGWDGFTFVLDWVATYKPTGMTWAIDHKFRKQMQKEETEEYNLQMPTYQAGLLQIGIPTVGTMTNQISVKLPAKPSLNKNGTMSRVKIASNWETYEQALLENNLNPADYIEDMKPKLCTEFFKSNYEYRGATEIVNTWNEVVVKAANEMANNPSFIRNLGQLGCRNCWVKDYCKEELRGGDLEYLLKTQYMPRSLAHHDAEIIDTGEEDEGGEE